MWQKTIVLTLLSATMAWSAVEPGSAEDYDLGRKRLAEMQSIVRQRVLPRTYAFVRSQTKYSGRLFLSNYLFDDRPLFIDRGLWEESESDHKMPSFARTFELYRLSGLDGYATFAWPGEREFKRTMKVIYDTAAQMKLSPDDFHLMLETSSSRDYMEIVPETLDLIANNPYSFRVNGKSLISSYVMDRMAPEEIAGYLQRLRELSGDKVLFVPQIHFLRLKNPAGEPINGHALYELFRSHGQALPASQIALMEEYLRSYLAVCDGIYLGHFNSYPDGSFDDEFSGALLAICRSVLAEPAYNGRKLLVTHGKAGYTAYYGAQNLSRDGTRTLRRGLELASKYATDVYIGTEWDELNEDTGFQPLVSKPMSSQRILRYYTHRFRNTAPTPLPGDDVTIPNLIISQRRQLVLGEAVVVELLHVPDTAVGENYTLRYELTDEGGKVLHQAGPFTFNTAVLREERLSLPSESFAAAQALRSRVTIAYQGRTLEYFTGLPFTAIRTTSTGDQQYFCTPLRNVLRPVQAEVTVALDGRVGCRLEAPEDLAVVEVIQNSLEQYAYDPRDEFRLADGSRRLYRLRMHYYNQTPSRVSVKIDAEVTDATGVLSYKSDADPRQLAAVMEGLPSPVYRGNLDWWQRNCLFSLPVAEVANAVLRVFGQIMNGPRQGEKFAWEVALAELGENDVRAQVYESGIMLGVESGGRPTTIPLSLDSRSAVFQAKAPFNQPNGVAAVRAVTKAGKVWWSAPQPLAMTPAPETAQTTRPVYVYSDTARQAVRLDLPAYRVPDAMYVFDPAVGGAVLKTPAGRDFYAMLGSYQAFATGFQGLESAYTLFRFFKNGVFDGADKAVPDWCVEDGRHCLRFDGERGNFVMFPNVVLPQRAGFTLEFEVKPEEVKPSQVLFAHQGNTFGGLNIEVKDGYFVLVYVHRNLHDWSLPWYLESRFPTQVPLLAGQWQTVKVTYNGSELTIAANGRREVFPLRGTGIYL
ncbi:MAG TPA: laminin G domain-containing protein, partial [Lentisphaeria bacterium]|nr:laminin G domain-containing protein [Lentisphaeria bacterium]